MLNSKKAAAQVKRWTILFSLFVLFWLGDGHKFLSVYIKCSATRLNNVDAGYIKQSLS